MKALLLTNRELEILNSMLEEEKFVCFSDERPKIQRIIDKVRAAYFSE